MNFVSIDVETANADMSSICQIGIAKYIDGELVDQWESLIDPEDYFDAINVDIHGINKKHVIGKPKLPGVIKVLQAYLDNSICVSHTHFDRVSLHQAFKKYSIGPFEISWLDSAKVVRRVWPEFSRKGYGLSNVCKKIGYEFEHHNALEDAKAAGYILLTAISESGTNLEYWLTRVKQPINPQNSSVGRFIRREGNPEGALFGDVVVFTGYLEMPRKDAANLAATIGFEVAAGVTRKTTVLIVGNQDYSKLAGEDKSNKHRKAEQLILKGQKIRIITESDFVELVNQA